MIRDKVKQVLKYHDKQTYTYLANVINFFYANFDTFNPLEKETLYRELEATRNYLNTPRPIRKIVTNGKEYTQYTKPDVIEQDDVYPPIYTRYEEYIKTRTQKLEQRTPNTEPLKIFLIPFKYIFSFFSSSIPTFSK